MSSAALVLLVWGVVSFCGAASVFKNETGVYINGRKMATDEEEFDDLMFTVGCNDPPLLVAFGSEGLMCEIINEGDHGYWTLQVKPKDMPSNVKSVVAACANDGDELNEEAHNEIGQFIMEKGDQEIGKEVMTKCEKLEFPRNATGYLECNPFTIKEALTNREPGSVTVCVFEAQHAPQLFKTNEE